MHEPNHPPLVQLRDVRFAYQLELVFDHIDWQWPAGSHVAVLGGNGAGKTTLARLLTDELRPNHGDVVYAAGLKASDIAHISFDLHRQMMERDRRFDDSETR